jgi:leucyl-tRNA synthetase
MAVPAHDERDYAFAQKYGLGVKPVVRPLPLAHVPNLNAVPSVQQTEVRLESECFVGEGEAINSDFLNGLPTWKAKQNMISWLEEQKKGERAVTYKLRDWVFSRQRYWGEPIPVIKCEKCGYVPVPDDQLPVVLPNVEAYEPTDTGESPLAKIRDWVEVSCPTCGGKAERETDTMPNWAGSSWYFLRYCDPQNDQALADPEKLKYWMPVDLYNGGMEHTTLHLLYSRFWYKFLWDIGVVPKECGSEPYRARRSHGLILAEGGEKMSKSKGNVVNPDDVLSVYGADAFRVYIMFMGPYDQPVPWDMNGIEGVKRFLDKVWGLFEVSSNEYRVTSEVETLYHQTVKKITEGIEKLEFNTCVSQLMILANAYQEVGGVPKDQRVGFLQLLAPFAPHLTEELWRLAGKEGSIHRSGWPAFDPAKLQSEHFELVIQVNGKVRDRIQVSSGISEGEAKEQALASEKVQALLQGKPPQQVVYVKGRLVNIVV